MKPVETILTIINSHFENTVTIDNAVLEYAFSVIGLDNINQITEILGSHDEYCEGLKELIFSPPYRIKYLIEGSMPFQGIPPDSIEEMVHSVHLGNNYANCIFTNSRTPPFKIELTKNIIRNFINKCRLDKALFIKETLDKKYRSDTLFLHTCVLMRNSRYRETPGKNNFLVNFITHAINNSGTATGKYKKWIELLVNVFQEDSNDCEPLALLLNRKKSLEGSVRRLSSYYDLVNQYSFEVVRSENVSVPFIDIKQAENEITVIDSIFKTLHI